MFQSQLVKVVVSVTLSVALTLGGIFPITEGNHPAYAANILTANNKISKNLIATNSPINWYQIEKDIIDAFRVGHDLTEKFVAAELNDWLDILMKKVDDKFLNWYFSYWNQKAQEFGIPFAWLAFKTDSVLKILRKKDENKLNSMEIVKKRMIEDFQNKFNEMVLDQEAKEYLTKLIERAGINYASAVGIRLANIKYTYKISDKDWERYLNNLSYIVYDTGNSNNTLEIESSLSNMGTKWLIVSTTVGGKLAVNFAVKSAAKIVGKTSGAILAKVGAQLIDPLLAVAILAWDVWDYNNMVKQSRPILRQNILDYLTEIKFLILNSPDNSIMAAIEEIEGKVIAGLESKLILDAS